MCLIFYRSFSKFRQKNIKLSSYGFAYVNNSSYRLTNSKGLQWLIIRIKIFYQGIRKVDVFHVRNSVWSRPAAHISIDRNLIKRTTNWKIFCKRLDSFKLKSKRINSGLTWYRIRNFDQFCSNFLHEV